MVTDVSTQMLFKDNKKSLLNLASKCISWLQHTGGIISTLGHGFSTFLSGGAKKEWRHGSECRHDSTWNISVTESSTLYWHIMILVIDWNVINMQNVFTDILHFSPTGKNDNRMTNITVTVWKDDKLFPHIRGLIVRIDSFVTDRVTSVWLLYDHSMMAMSDFALLMV